MSKRWGNKVVGKVHDDIPDKLAGLEDAMAYFGVLDSLINDQCSMISVQ